MDNPGRLFSQIAAEAGITDRRAKVAVYLFGLARDGRTVEQAAIALRRKPNAVKLLARDFLIDFSDYRPFARERDKGQTVQPRLRLNTVA